jgi:reversibly glycosylated polypeptide/UDP-arabinopyranose mutase
MKIAVVVPTIRPELFIQTFLPAWVDLFRKHRVHVFAVVDGEKMHVKHKSYEEWNGIDAKISMGEKLYSAFPAETLEPIYNYTDACRNLGFYVAKREIDPDIYISLDDDVLPIEGTDPIQQHIDVLNQTVQMDWQNTSTTHRMRGLPYNLPVYPVWLSHGVWKGVPDLDAIQQLQYPEMKDVDCPKMKIPPGVYFPLCAMNFAFRKELLPWAYQAPMGRKLAEDGLPVYDRFADIWSGLVMKWAIDDHQAAAVTGFSTIYHSRASNVYTNLKKEAVGIEVNENIWKFIYLLFLEHFSPAPNQDSETTNYLKLYHKRLTQWQKLIQHAE